MAVDVSIIIPAWNEADRIGRTLRCLRQLTDRSASRFRAELIVVDDGSDDGTAQAAQPWADVVLRNSVNRGKGYSLAAGWERASGELLLFLDADLGDTADRCIALLEPLQSGVADMTVARLPAPERKGGVGLVKGLASIGIRALCGFEPLAPLSGQRAVRADAMKRIGRLSEGFGVEVGLTIDAVRLGCRVVELEVPFAHRETGRDWHSWKHRGRQFCSVGKALWIRRGNRLC